MSIGSNERELGSALKHLPVEGLVSSFPTTDEILRLGKQRRARHRATLVGLCAAAVFLTIFGVNSLTGPRLPRTSPSIRPQPPSAPGLLGET